MSRLRDFDTQIKSLTGTVAQGHAGGAAQAPGGQEGAAGAAGGGASLSGFPIRCLSCSSQTGGGLGIAQRPTPPETRGKPHARPTDKLGYDLTPF